MPNITTAIYQAEQSFAKASTVCKSIHAQQNNGYLSEQSFAKASTVCQSMHDQHSNVYLPEHPSARESMRKP